MVSVGRYFQRTADEPTQLDLHVTAAQGEEGRLGRGRGEIGFARLAPSPAGKSRQKVSYTLS